MASRGRPPLPLGTWGEISVERRTNGWIARTRFRDFDGRTRPVARTGKTKGAARNALTECLTMRSVSAESAEITGDTKLMVAIEMHYGNKTTKEAWATNTRRRYREVIDGYISPRMGGLRIQEVTVGRLDSFLQSVTKDVGAPTAKLCKSVLSGAMSIAVRHGALAANPVRETDTVKVVTKEVETLELTQIAMLRRIAIERDQPNGKRGRRTFPCTAAIVDTLLGTGCRIGEVFAIRTTEDLNLEAAKVAITGTVIRDDVTGKMVRQPHNKTKKELILGLPPFTVATLSEYVVTVPPNTEGLLFPSANGTVRDPNNFRKIWRQMIKEAGLPAGTTPHTLRKTVATHLEEMADSKTAADQLGDDERTALKYYIKNKLEGPDVADLLEGLVSPGLMAV